MKNKELHSEFTFQIEPKHYFKHMLLRIWPGMIVASGLCVARIRWIPNARPCRAIVDSLFSICASSFFRSLSAPVLPFIVNICRKIHRRLAGV